jgi:hypothetical protein
MQSRSLGEYDDRIAWGTTKMPNGRSDLTAIWGEETASGQCDCEGACLVWGGFGLP